MVRYPSWREPLDWLFLLCVIALTADVLVPEIFGNGKTKDYPLWYWAGQQVLHGLNLYPSDPSAQFEFIYPPLSAVLLAIPAWFGKIPLYLVLSLLNAVAWWMTGQFSNAMTGAGRTPGPWLFALPSFVTITFIFDMYDLGQPNLVLLALMLYGFWLLQGARPWLGGCMFALATAIKVFPVAVLPYLVWRRQWKALASTLIFLVHLAVRAAGAVPRLRSQRRRAEDLVSRHGRRPARKRALASATSRTGRGSTSRSSR